MNILIVDDVKFFREIEKSILRRTNCEVLEACNGEEALAIISAEPPDLILMDLLMPGMNGDECCRIIKSDPSLKHIPVLMVSSADSIDDQGRCYAAGCDDYITKPVDKNILLDKIRSFLDIIVRSHIRVPVDLEVALQAGAVSNRGRVKNISEAGIFVETLANLSAGTNTKMKFSLFMDQLPLEVEGEVVRIEEDSDIIHPDEIFNGIGIKFNSIPFRARQYISEFVNHSSTSPN